MVHRPAPDHAGRWAGAVSIKGKVSIDGAKYALAGVQLGLDQIKGTADFAVDTGGARPSIKGKLAVDKLDLNHYMAPAGNQSQAATPNNAQGNASGAKSNPTPAAAQGWSDEPIDSSGLKAANVNLTLAADAIVWRKVEVGKTAVQITLDGGRLTFDLTDMALYQGAVRGRVQVDGSGPVLGTDANLRIDKVQVEPLLKALADTDRVSGLAVADTTLNSKGKSQKELIGALSGKGSLALQNGVVKGIDLVGMVKNAAASAVGGNGGETAFTTASGTYTYHGGHSHQQGSERQCADAIGHRCRYRQLARAHPRLQAVDQSGVHPGGAGRREGALGQYFVGRRPCRHGHSEHPPTPERALAALPVAPATL